MLQETLALLFERDLLKLKEEITLYKHEDELWRLVPGISNTGGNLCLHLVGNLNHFIGATLGNTGYIRNREAEFTSKHIPAASMIADITATITVVKETLAKLTDQDFQNDFPLPLQGKTFSTEQMLLNMLTHLNYHLGQINYHRRVVAG